MALYPAQAVTTRFDQLQARLARLERKATLANQMRTSMQDANPAAVQAFLADYKKGLDLGVIYSQMPNNQGLSDDSGTRLMEAVESLKLLAKNMGQLAVRRRLKISERAMAQELGRICATLFTHCGIVQGMSKG